MDDKTTPTILERIRRLGLRWDARLSELLREVRVARPRPVLVPIRVRSRTIYRPR